MIKLHDHELLMIGILIGILCLTGIIYALLQVKQALSKKPNPGSKGTESNDA